MASCASSSCGGKTIGRGMKGLNLSFCGCGFLGMYHVGSAAAWAEEFASGGRFRLRNALGSSAGSVIAAALLAEISPDLLRSKFLALATKAESLTFGAFNPKFNVNEIFAYELDRVLPSDAHSLLSGRLYVSITDLKTMKNELVSDFRTRKELIDALVCSCFMPAFSGYSLPTFRSRICVDGGFSDNQPLMPDGSPTVRISPFSGSSQISPGNESSKKKKMTWKKGGEEVEISKKNLRRFMYAVSPTKNLEELYLDGYYRTKKFIEDPDSAQFLVEESEKEEENQS